MFYELTQNNSGGYFIVDEKVCHRLFIEATSEEEAIRKAESLGCYWDGVENGNDCSCCGDRWSKYLSTPLELDSYKSRGMELSAFGDTQEEALHKFIDKYEKYELIEPPTVEPRRYFGYKCVGFVRFSNIKEYAQLLADKYGWTNPDARIYYADGKIDEVFMSR